MKLKKKDDQSVDDSVLLRRRKKILIGGNMETKCGAKNEGKAIQRLPHLEIQPIHVQPQKPDNSADAKKYML